MPEKLLTLSETADVLGISEEIIRKLVETGELPAYRIGGKFLRFRKEQIEAIRDEVPRRLAEKQRQQRTRRVARGREGAVSLQSPLDSVLDFFYFNDFYLIAAGIIILILWVILKY
ncbi:MAG: helix-turn-helix domain-containing protein [Candidatus Omnitrophota bacterium]